MCTDDMLCCWLNSFFTSTFRYWFLDSRQRITTLCIIVLCCLPPSSPFVLYQGTTQKLDQRDITMLKELKVEDRRTIYDFCRLVVVFPERMQPRMSEEQVKNATPICEQLLLGIKKEAPFDRRVVMGNLRGAVILLLFTSVTCLRPTTWAQRRAPAAVGESAQTSATMAFFTQKLDHFNSTNTQTFTQRYFYTTEFAQNNVAFLEIGGEGAVDGSYMENTTIPYVKYAKDNGASLFLLEHRFYGLSRPFATQSVENLVYLTSKQAIEDVASFITFATKQYNMAPKTKWIVFGASYAGNLAAWTRSKHPELVVGAVSSSAPIQAKLDYWEYMDQMEQSIRLLGSNDCAANISASVAEVVTSMSTVEGRHTLSTVLPLQLPLDQTNLTYNDIQKFYDSLFSSFEVVVQFNSEFGLSIADMCKVMTNATLKPVEKLRDVFWLVQGDLGDTQKLGKMENSYNDVVTLLLNETYDNPDLASSRSWFWQLCNEFGLLPSTDGGEYGIFGATIPSSLYINQCMDIFGNHFDAMKIRDNVEATNAYYGGIENYPGTNVVFINGAADPYSRIGKTRSRDNSVVCYTIKNGSHAEDVFPKNSFTVADVQNAQALIQANLFNWINGPPNPVTSINTTDPWTRPNSAGSAAARSMRSSATNSQLFAHLSEDVPSKKTYPPWKKHRKVWLGRPPHGLRPAPEAAAEFAGYPPGYEAGTFRQRVDHFDNTNANTFQQKYFKNAQWAKSGGPNFLMIGGEGPESDRWVLNENLTYLLWAQKYGATVYLLEHRYYGDSVVGDNNDLTFLSSLQMLYDLADFIKAINLKTGNTAPWITFGGSYSGAMSAWMREVFPDLVLGAVGSSGPVFAKIDFFEYLMVVENSIRTYNDECANRIASGFEEMQKLFMTPEGRVNLSSIFSLQPAWKADSVVSELGQHYFFSNIYGNYQGAVQYSGDNTGPYAIGYGIPDMCKIMLNDSNTPIQNVAKFNEFMTEVGPFSYTDNNYQGMIDDLKNAQKYGPNSAASLLWTWQTCTEFGYFQSTDSGHSIFGSPTPVNMYTQMCTDVFGNAYNAETIEAAIKHTNWVYGSRDKYRGTNVVLPNGSLDPWHALGKYTANDPSVVPFLINGTAHCADMYPARDADVPDLAKVRALIDTNIGQWLSNAPPPPTTAVPGGPTDVTKGTGPTQSPQPPTTTQGSSRLTSLLAATVVLFLFSLNN
ncbi:unnamed protein product [Caenorhabditis auriculariae]|uniref:Uncharacterized protein n=1 Tax=Caenorhabditis auriculariae TaxID=2777116 RepID=A0A8S1H662_9PELO|nr:unnamed protein product [Caenorhabditis auriculariae]